MSRRPGAAAPRRRVRWPVLAAAATGAAGLVGVGAWGLAVARAPAARSGSVLVVATVERPVPGSARATVWPIGLALHRSGVAWGRGWTRRPVRSPALSLPGRAVAPGVDTLFEVRVPVGRYDGVAFGWRGRGGPARLQRTRAVVQVGAAGLTPVLLSLRLAGGPSQGVRLAAAYGGNDQLNFGLQVAAGTELSVPTIPLTDAGGRPISLRRFRGHVVVLASFLTECQETCPLVDAALLQVERSLAARGLAGQVRVVLVTQDPAVDTPAAIGRYARHFHLPFTLLTGGVSAVNAFWTRLHVPLPVYQRLRGRGPIDPFTGRRETTNPLHASVVMVVDPQGQVVAQLLGQPTLRDGVPTLVARYLDALGRAELRSGGSWSPQVVVDSVLTQLQGEGVGGAFPTPQGAPCVARVGQPAPPFTLRSSQGGWVSLTRQRGHPVILDFWATWCRNCRAELPLLDRTARADAGRGLRLLLVDYQQGRGTAVSYLRRLGVRRPTLLDPDGTVALRFGVEALPVNVFITQGGRVSGIQVGQLGRATLSAQLKGILRSRALAAA